MSALDEDGDTFKVDAIDVFYDRRLGPCSNFEMVTSAPTSVTVRYLSDL